MTSVDIGGGGKGDAVRDCDDVWGVLVVGGVDCRPSNDAGREMLGCPPVWGVAPGFIGVDVVLDRCVFGVERGV